MPSYRLFDGNPAKPALCMPHWLMEPHHQTPESRRCAKRPVSVVMSINCGHVKMTRSSREQVARVLDLDPDVAGAWVGAARRSFPIATRLRASVDIRQPPPAHSA